jgi:hypothetical protein
MIQILLIVLSLLMGCQSLEKERLELDKQILEFEKERFKKCGCCVPVETHWVPPGKIVSGIKTGKDCVRIAPPSSEDIWKIAEDGNWSYSPKNLKLGEICREETKESFYKIYQNSESYVAETQVPKTKRSSCINNVLFHGKDKLYDLMLEKTAKDTGIQDYEKERFTKVKNETIEYNTAEKGRSFYYECKPTDSQGAWNTCKCVLFASYAGGEDSLGKRMKKN